MNDPQPLDLDALRRAWGLPDKAPAPVSPIDEEEERNRIRKLIRAQRMERFNEFCPLEFRQKIDESKIPNIAAWREADRWTGSHPGLWLWSDETGEAKTRMLWRKYGQLHVDQGKTVLRIGGVNLGEAYAEAYFASKTELFYSRFSKMAVVMLDDLDKIPLTEQDIGYREKEIADRNTRMLHHLFNHFYEWRKPVLVTANQNIAWFHERLGESAARRIRAVCSEIAF